MMDAETLERIERITAKADELRIQIRDLEADLENVYEEDEEYAGYLQAYRSYYTDEPLTIRRYYELSEELEVLNGQFKHCPPAQFEDLYQRYERRIQYLERVLAA